MPSTVKSYIGSTQGSVGSFDDEVEIPEGPPFWRRIPDQSTNFKDLPQSLDLKQYARGNPEITDWGTDVGTVDANGILTIPEGTDIDEYSVTVSATNSLGTTPTTFIWAVTAEEAPAPTLYVNAQFAGGTSGTPGSSPDNHTFSFTGGSVEYEITRNNEYYTLETSADNNRQVVQYAVATNNPDLVVGTTYVIAVSGENVGPNGSSTRAISLSNRNEIEIVQEDFSIPLGESKVVYFAFRPLAVGWTCNFRLGTGTTTNRSETFRFYRPVLVEVGQTVPIWETVPDQETNVEELPSSLDMKQYVENPLPVEEWQTTFGQINTNGILTIPAGTAVGDYEIEVTCINPLEQATSDPFTWSISEGLVNPTIDRHPQDSTVIAPQGTSFNVVASHPTGPLFYQWEASDDGVTWVSPETLASDVDVASITTDTLLLNSTEINQNLPNIFAHPVSRTILVPNGVQFFCGANHPQGADLFYEWEASDDGGQTWQSPELVASDVNIASITTNLLTLESTEL